MTDTIAPATTGERESFHGGKAPASSLVVKQVTKRYGAVAAVEDVSFAVPERSTTAIIGPNGAGKTTLLRTIAGSVRPTVGDVVLDGKSISGRGAHRASHAGVAYAHQVPQPFSDLTVRDNVRVGATEHHLPDAEDYVDYVLELCGLEDRAKRLARELQVLDLKRLELARALSTRPSLLLLDEVCAGLSGRELDQVIKLVDAIRLKGPTVILVEHIEAVVAQLAERVLVLDWGHLIADGTPDEIEHNEQVREVYVGGGHDGVAAHVADFGADAGTNGTTQALVIEDLKAGYGSIEALHGVSVEIRPGRVSALLGANGAGKTTLSNAIAGTVPIRAGSITVDGARIDRLPAHERAAMGVAVVREGRTLFTDLTVRENLVMPAGFRTAKKEIAARLDEVLAIFPQIEQFLGRKGGQLSGGQQQMVAIGRALMAKPRYLICDEVSLGLAPVAIDALYEGLLRVVELGVGLGVVEQHVQRGLAVADMAYVIDRGQISYAGPPGPLTNPERLDEVYFGTTSAMDLTLRG